MAEAEDIIKALDLQPHPEGGHFAETWRHSAGSETHGPGGETHSAGSETRGAGSAIYFLLRRGERSRWHRIDSNEIWHYYAGSPLTLRMADGEGTCTHMLGPNLRDGERPQLVVPPMAWQCAESSGDFTLVGCTVSPAFLFDHFEMAEAGWEPS